MLAMASSIMATACCLSDAWLVACASSTTPPGPVAVQTHCLSSCYAWTKSRPPGAGMIRDSASVKLRWALSSGIPDWLLAHTLGQLCLESLGFGFQRISWPLGSSSNRPLPKGQLLGQLVPTFVPAVPPVFLDSSAACARRRTTPPPPPPGADLSGIRSVTHRLMLRCVGLYQPAHRPTPRAPTSTNPCQLAHNANTCTEQVRQLRQVAPCESSDDGAEVRRDCWQKPAPRKDDVLVEPTGNASG